MPVLKVVLSRDRMLPTLAFVGTLKTSYGTLTELPAAVLNTIHPVPSHCSHEEPGRSPEQSVKHAAQDTPAPVLAHGLDETWTLGKSDSLLSQPLVVERLQYLQYLTLLLRSVLVCGRRCCDGVNLMGSMGVSGLCGACFGRSMRYRPLKPPLSCAAGQTPVTAPAQTSS